MKLDECKLANCYSEYGNLVLRSFFGVAFIVAGLDKILSFGMAKEMFENIFANLGEIILVIAILIELSAGISLLLGYNTRYAAGLLAFLILIAFISTFKLGPSTNIIGTLREIMVMNTGGGNTAVNFAYFGALVSLVFSESKKCT